MRSRVLLCSSLSSFLPDLLHIVFHDVRTYIIYATKRSARSGYKKYQKICVHLFDVCLSPSFYHWMYIYLTGKRVKTKTIHVDIKCPATVYAWLLIKLIHATACCTNSNTEEMLHKHIEIYWKYSREVQFLIERNDAEEAPEGW